MRLSNDMKIVQNSALFSQIYTSEFLIDLAKPHGINKEYYFNHFVFNFDISSTV